MKSTADLIEPFFLGKVPLASPFECSGLENALRAIVLRAILIGASLRNSILSENDAAFGWACVLSLSLSYNLFMNKKQLLTFRISEIVQIRYLLSKDSVSRDAAEAIFAYFECECLYKKLLWPIAKSNNPTLKREQLKVRPNVVPRVLHEYGIEADPELITRIFGSQDGNLTTCSIKKLRDRFVHNCTDYTIQAIVERKEEILSDINCFLSLLDS